MSSPEANHPVLGADTGAVTSEPVRDYEPIQPGGEWKRRLRRLGAPFALLAALLAKFKFVLLFVLKLKLVATSLTMLVSVAAYAWIWGWPFALGLVALLFVHELGHVIEAKRQGLPVSGVYFVPFLGAVMGIRRGSRTAAQAAWLGLAGPIVGSLGALATWGLGRAFDSPLLVALAFTGFLINLFNLIPVLPLDGGWATAVFHPLFWAFGLVGLVGLWLVWPSPIVLVIAILGAYELWRRWRDRDSAQAAAYYEVTPRQRAAIAACYLALAVLLGLGMSATHVKRTFHDRDQVATATPAIPS